MNLRDHRAQPFVLQVEKEGRSGSRNHTAIEKRLQRELTCRSPGTVLLTCYVPTLLTLQGQPESLPNLHAGSAAEARLLHTCYQHTVGPGLRDFLELIAAKYCRRIVPSNSPCECSLAGLSYWLSSV